MPETLATFEHLDDRLSEERGQYEGMDKIRIVLACRKCNQKKGVESQKQLNLEELRERSGRFGLRSDHEENQATRI